ncbi:MAG: DUF4832 domain-containing protein [Caldilineaceae bacterium]|nr:DUF4832 domain-containing protein [Caldilineaceae bacterium]
MFLGSMIPQSAFLRNRLLLILVTVLLVTQHAADLRATPVAQMATVTYAPSTANIANPERGFHHLIETRGSAPNVYLASLLQSYRTNDQITLLNCIVYLDTFVNSPISAAFLQHLTDNFATVREAGLKCILRFAYTENVNNTIPPFGDATKQQILDHLDQLAPILQANSDVIAVMQAGFIGVWGEWYYTDHFVDDPTTPWIVSPARHADRLEVLTRILDILPSSHFVQVRTPFAKQGMLNTTTPLSAAQAYGNSTAARTGYHNDCFLASETDFGTFRTDQILTDKNFMAIETQYLPMGGESCNPNPPRSLCSTALTELALFHYSYFNRVYHPDVYNSWVTGGCIDDIQRQLGYRFVLLEGNYSNVAAPGGAFSFHLVLQNQGYAAPFNPRPVHLVLRNQVSGDIYTVPMVTDPRYWWAGSTTTIDEVLTLPSDIPAGHYDLLLHLPAPETSLQNRPDYAIQFANATLWESSTGYNHLNHTMTIQTDLQSGDCNADALVDAGDTAAIALEIFDNDGNSAVDAAGGSFPGNARCDATGDTVIDTNDVYCTMARIFNGPSSCGP